MGISTALSCWNTNKVGSEDSWQETEQGDHHHDDHTHVHLPHGPPSQRAAADPGPKHGENPVPCKETKPEIKIVRITAFTTTTSLPTRETRSPPPWPTRSSPPSAAPASHETPGTYEARGRTLPPQCSPPPPPRGSNGSWRPPTVA